MHASSKWIWLDCAVTRDQYGEFYDSFTYTGGSVCLQISADSNYAVYLNGQPVDSGQYPDFPHYKIYDELDLTPAVRPGKNHLAIIVWYYGESNMSYFRGRAALRYVLDVDGSPVCRSDEATLSRQSPAYRNNYGKIITGQLGFSFHYDLTREDGWMQGALFGFAPSRVVEQELPLFPRPIPKFIVGAPIESACIRSDENRYLFDLGRESAGYLFCRLRADRRQKLLIAYGEHIVDGGVRRHIGGRDFSVELTVGEGENEYFNPFRRLGLRYLEVFSEAPV
ncbi:MAG: family 78 glycoside hydrolase catalytic domain, partial [Clostridia bacterium]|nr:family 78 glycoside hydrolase catalytic domain [Clostridia bacterium]